MDGITDSYIHIESDREEVPVDVFGWAVLLDKKTIPKQVAVAVNGEIVPVASPCCARARVTEELRNRKFLKSGWFTVISSQKLSEGANAVTAYVVLDAKAKKLALLNTKNNTIQLSSK